MVLVLSREEACDREWPFEQPQDGVVCVLGKSLVSIALLALSTLAVLAGAMYSRAWSAGQQTNRWKSAATCFVSVLAVWALVSTSWYVNGSFISDGERITFWDALGDLGRFLGGIVACLDDPSLEYCKDFGIVSDSTWRGRSAYEVLGLPHGAPYSQVRSKYLGALVWFPACLSVASLVALISHAQPSVMYIESSVVHFTALALATHPDKCGSCRSVLSCVFVLVVSSVSYSFLPSRAGSDFLHVTATRKKRR